MGVAVKTEQIVFANNKWMPDLAKLKLRKEANLVFLFGGRECLEKKDLIESARKCYPNAILLGCSSAGEIADTKISDNALVATAVFFEKTKLQTAHVSLKNMSESFQAGEKLAHSLNQSGLKHIFVLSDGLEVNGSELVKGISSVVPNSVAITGGLAGDGANFKKTSVLLNDSIQSNQVAAIGFFGEKIQIGYSSMGGWDVYGVSRRITRSKGNVLYELDGKPALEFYKLYLGDKAKDLPASALLFPLSIRKTSQDTPVVRTVLGVNEEDQSMTFAGDVPEGYTTQFMKANFSRLVDGASQAAAGSLNKNTQAPDLALLISCIGRKLVLKQRTEEETEAVRSVFGPKTAMTGFYSYGEISPFTPNAKCELHNQTMTITTFKED